MNKFRIKDSLDAAVYRAYNLLSGALFHLDVEARRLIRGNLAFKNIHQNERCFILGTGPSLAKLTSDQIENLKPEVLFGVNSFYKTDLASVLQPKYYALMDDLYWKELSDVFSEVAAKFASNRPTFITDSRARSLIESLSPAAATPVYIYAKKYPITEMSEEITQNVFATMNVVSTCILAAIYMGFKEIYLLGCDYNCFGNAGGHCYDDEEELDGKKDFDGFAKNLAFYLRFYWITTEFHYLIAKLAKRRGVKVINLTPTSLLDAYPRRPVSDVL